MAFTVKKRGKLTYYSQGERPVLSSLVTEELPDGDLKISFAGLTGGYSAKNVLGLDELVTMDPAREIPLVFACWERWLQEAGICESLRDVDFIEIHAFGCQPKSPNPLVDPTGFAREQERLRKAYAEAYAGYFATHLPDNGVPCPLHRPRRRRSRHGRLIRVLRHRAAATVAARARPGLRSGGPDRAMTVVDQRHATAYPCRNVRGALVTRSGLPLSWRASVSDCSCRLATWARNRC